MSGQHQLAGVADDDVVDLARAVDEDAHLPPRLDRDRRERPRQLRRRDVVGGHATPVEALERAQRRGGEARLVAVDFDTQRVARRPPERALATPGTTQRRLAPVALRPWRAPARTSACCGREAARGIGGARVARQREGLAAAAAEVDVAPVAALARLGHPRFAAEGAHPLAPRARCARAEPSRTLSNGSGSVRAAWHGSTAPSGATTTKRRRPAVHAGARAVGVPVGQNEDDLHPARQALASPRAPRRARGRSAPASGSSAVAFSCAHDTSWTLASSSRSAPSRSAIATTSSTRSRFARCRTTLSVSGSPSSFTHAGDAHLRRVRREPGDAVARGRVGVLHAELHVVDATARAARAARDRGERRSSRGSRRARDRALASRWPRDRSARAARRR